MSEALKLEASPAVVLNKNFKLSLFDKPYESFKKVENLKAFQFHLNHAPFDAAPQLTVAMQHTAHNAAPVKAPGLEKLRQLVAEDLDLESSKVLVGSGISQLVNVLFQALDGVFLIPTPSSQFYFAQANALGKKAHLIPTNAGTKFKLTVANLESTLANFDKADQKILILSSPSLITGQSYSDSEIKALVRFCKENSIKLVVDESLTQLMFEEVPAMRFSKYYGEGTIVLQDFGKAYAASGYQLAFALIPPTMQDLFDLCSLYMQRSSLSVSAPIQHAAQKVIALQAPIKKHMKQCNRIHQTCSYYAYSRLLEMSLATIRPEAGYCVYINFKPFQTELMRRGISSSVELAAHLAKYYQVILTPAENFEVAGKELALRVSCVDYNGQLALSAAEQQSVLDRTFVEKYCSRLVRGLDAIEAFVAALEF